MVDKEPKYYTINLKDQQIRFVDRGQKAIDLLHILKDHMNYGNGVLSILINEYDEDFERVIKEMEDF